MLRLLPLYKDWPTYDGSLASKATSRFLMFCTRCAGYISTTGRLIFADFPQGSVTEISKERSELPWWDSPVETVKATEEFFKALGSPCNEPVLEPVDNLIIGDTPESMLVDEPKADPEAVTPAEMMKKLDKRIKTSRKKKGK
jgi:hypothetical protein